MWPTILTQLDIIQVWFSKQVWNDIDLFQIFSSFLEKKNFGASRNRYNVLHYGNKYCWTEGGEVKWVNKVLSIHTCTVNLF